MNVDCGKLKIYTEKPKAATKKINKTSQLMESNAQSTIFLKAGKERKGENINEKNTKQIVRW